MNRIFKTFLILIITLSAMIVVASIFGGFLAHAITQDNSSGVIHSVTAINDDCFLMGCKLDKLIQLQEQENKLLAYNTCINANHYLGIRDIYKNSLELTDCASQVLNDTK